MAYAPDAYVKFPIVSGSEEPTLTQVYLQVVQQVHSSSVRIVFRPSGGMTGSIMIAPNNHNRVRFTIMNSGSATLGLAHGHPFVPNVAPTEANHFDNIIVGTDLQQQGNQPTNQAVAWEAPLPCYTGPLYIAWFGSGSLSGSCAILTEFQQHD